MAAQRREAETSSFALSKVAADGGNIECQSDGLNETCDTKGMQEPVVRHLQCLLWQRRHMANKCKRQSLLLPKILAHTLMIA